MKFVVILAVLSCTSSNIVATPDVPDENASGALDASPIDDAERDVPGGSRNETDTPSDGASDILTDVPPIVPLPKLPCPVVTGEASCTEKGEAGKASGAVNESVFEDAYTCAPVVLESEPCPLGACDLGRCLTSVDEPPPDTEWFVADLISLDPKCCFDLTGDGIMDNAVANSFIGAMLTYGKGTGEFEDVTDPIRKGHLLLGVGLRRSSDPMLWIARLDRLGDLAVPYPATPDVVLKLRPTALVPGSATPRTRISLTPSGDGWEGETARAILELVTGSLGLPLQFRNFRVRVTPNDTGLRVEIGALLRLDDLAQDINRIFSANCSCWHDGAILGLSKSTPGTLTSFPVSKDPAPDCERSPDNWVNTNCVDLTQATLPGFAQALVTPDMDANADGTLDSLTAGLKLTAVPIGGVVPP